MKLTLGRKTSAGFGLVLLLMIGVAPAGYWGTHKISKAMIEMQRTDAELEGYSPAPESRHWTCGAARERSS
jgi:CHASE3 domain sensor protein